MSRKNLAAVKRFLRGEQKIMATFWLQKYYERRGLCV